VAEIDEFASSLLEEAKRFFELAIDHDDTSAKDAYLHSALMLAFCSLEAHVNAIAAELSEREEFSLQERAKHESPKCLWNIPVWTVRLRVHSPILTIGSTFIPGR
jgi:hypothetical protein